MTRGPDMHRAPSTAALVMLHVALQYGQKLRTVDGGGWAGPGSGVSIAQRFRYSPIPVTSDGSAAT